jgi:hypothetical protein
MTGLLLGPVVYLFWGFADFHSISDWLGFELGIVIYGLILSSPSIMLFSGGAAVLFLRSWDIPTKRLLSTLWGIFLTVGTFGVLFGMPFEPHAASYPGSICFIIPSATAVWFYTWPGRMK